MTRIYWDTMLFLYWLEPSRPEQPRVRAIWDAMRRRGDELCTGTITVGEVLAKPYRLGRFVDIARCRRALAPPLLTVLPFDLETADRYARIRAQHRVRPADAIHLATAAQRGVDLFLTNDRALVGLAVEGIDFIAPMDVDLF